MRRVFVFVLFIQYIICFTHNPFQSSNFGNNRYALTSEKSCRFGECQPVKLGSAAKKLSHNDVLHHRTHDKTLTNGIPLCEKSFRSFGNDHLAGNTVAVRFPIFNVTNILAINRTTSGFFLYEHQAPKTEAVTTAKVAIENMIKAKKIHYYRGRGYIESPFRNPRGICNNLKRPIFGSVFTPVQRILKNNYFDGKKCFSMPRRANDGRDLPSARFVLPCPLTIS
ncbi:PXDN [Lepeophtheirus salmonis]|uniref:PXDN n=1 Tax=Lepeophtheirus salmonis TaxID=72036 RepID=A0A7R8H7P5_LEPSM|nr:PXDN [Lepeophtheirus salmonis]CAF2924706.1 PXDN [Lepeophtheirus salmonis]